MYDKILKINIKGIEKEKITTILEDELNKKLQQSESRQRRKMKGTNLKMQDTSKMM